MLCSIAWSSKTACNAFALKAAWPSILTEAPSASYLFSPCTDE